MREKREDATRTLSANEGTDGLSTLPKEIKLCILSLLTMRDAARTDVLSSEWRGLWRSLPNLEFDAKNMFAGEPTRLKRTFFQNITQWGTSHFGGWVLWRRGYKEEEIRSTRTWRFVRSVDTFLDHHTCAGVERFSVSFPLVEKHAHPLDRWIKFAISSGTKILSLELCDMGSYSTYVDSSRAYKIPCELFAAGGASPLQWLHLCSCVVKPPPNFDGFGSLRDLILTKASMDEAAFHDLLVKCSRLERLQVDCCHWLVNLRICNVPYHLKSLKVAECYRVKSIVVSSMDLAISKYRGRTAEFDVQPHSSQLLRASFRFYPSTEIDPDYVLDGLPCYLPRLETLNLEFAGTCAKKWRPTSGNVFTNLKHLTVCSWTWWSRDLLWIVSLLKAAPFLETFQLDLIFFRASVFELDVNVEAARDIVRPPPHRHDHLKTVKLNGFRGYINETELALWVLNNATALEELSVDTRCVHDRGRETSLGDQDAVLGSEGAFKLLLAEAPPKVRIQLLTS